MWLQTTIGGAGHLTGDLTGPAAAAVTVVLEALSAKGGPEDTRTLLQRQHDGLQEACQRLIESGMLPGRDSQPLQLTVHVDLAELRGGPGATDRGRQPHRPVSEPVSVPVRGGAGPLDHLQGQSGQIAQLRAALGGGQQDPVRIRPAVFG